jgi:hypothetical protein
VAWAVYVTVPPTIEAFADVDRVVLVLAFRITSVTVLEVLL